MTITDTQPSNINYLHSNRYKFVIQRLPGINYFCNAVTIPGINMGNVDVFNPFIALPNPGDKLSFDPLSLRFKVDEDLKNYLEIMDWMISIGYPDSFEQYKEVARGNNRLNSPVMGNVFSDASVVLTTNTFNANKRVKFFNMFPITLSPMELASDSPDTNPIEASVTFRYQKFVIESV